LESSLTILTVIHARWCELLRKPNQDQWKTGYFHPELDRVVTRAEALPSYTWHVDHHLGQIAWLRSERGWD
jgi:hypothetical protein